MGPDPTSKPSLLAAIQEAWGWRGLEASNVVDVSPFGNILVTSRDGCIWRIRPEELSSEIVAASAPEFEQKRLDPAFAADWSVEKLVVEAAKRFGALTAGRCYCLKIPGVLGGKYESDNLATISLDELVRASGDMARQIADLPDGTRAKLVIATASDKR